MESNKIVNQENRILLIVGSSNSTSVSANKHAGLTSASKFSTRFLQYLHKAVVTILCVRHLYKGISKIVYLLLSLQMSLRVSLHEDILCHLYRGIFMTIHLLLSLLTSLRCKILQPSLCASLQSKFLQSSLPVSLRSGILQSSLLTSLLVFL